ncbi:diaminopimelate decarboxylase [Halorientalis sp. IM1011]|uniref:diaminopimelate decarboxylase n=1 Tax=Halorientalis sp. IM1011 TaxID=1932360 RepID=UPI00097CD428|nr:diaminopimelate decarboxylase [Halorientalis sp. IM1011]AQL41953.1 diaminopimelate decarboxylase [Halorientalis sp. IM1011]
MSSGVAVRRLSDWDAERLRDLAAEFDTPLYVLDPDRVRENAARLQSAFDAEEISYAVKANTTRPVLETIESTGVGAECASAGEVERALAAGFDGEAVRYTAVNPPEEDLDYVVDAAADHDLIVTVGAADTLDRLDERGFSGRLCIRANPGVGAGHHEKVSTGAAPKFGVPMDRVPDLASEAVDRGFDLVGLHAHAGSGISGEDLQAHRELVARMGDLARRVISDVGTIEFVNVGGGLGVPYREEEDPLDLDAVAAATREAFGDVDARLGIEPGRYFVADAGVLLTRVNTVKPTPETTVVGVDAGMTTLVRPAMYDSYHTIRSLASDADRRETVSVTVAGPICETADVLGEDRPLPDSERGDLLAVGNAGAYGYEMSSNYNSRPRPAVVALDGTDARLAVRREAVADITELETWSK